MPDVIELSLMNQRDVERNFAAVAYQYPLYTVSQCGWLSPAVIIDQQVRKFWDAMRRHVATTMDDDTAQVGVTQAALESGVHLELGRWGQGLPETAMPQAFAAEISRRAYLSGIGAKLGGLAQAIGQSDDLKARQVIDEMAHLTPVTGTPLPTAADVGLRFEELIDAGERSIDTYIPSLDTATGGLERQTLTILAARTSMGKTALGWQIARNIATAGATVIFFSLEMSAASLWARAACPMAGVTWRDFLAGRLSAEQKVCLKSKSAELRDLYRDHLLIPDTRQTSESIWRYTASVRPELVVIDHLRFVDDDGENENKRQGRVSKTLHDMAKAFNLPVLLMVQINRDAERDKSDKRPQLSHLRDSGEIEENADNVWMLYRDSYYNPPDIPLNKHPTELLVRKFRNGTQNIKVNLIFDARKEWFESPGRQVTET